MTERQAYVAFNLTDNVGFATVRDLVAKAGSAVAAWESFPKRKVSRTGGPVDWEGELAKAEKFGVELLTPADEGYPRMLREAPGAPLCLYVKGNVKALSAPMVALIGTRRATQYGIGLAHDLSFDLCQAGWGVVSGLALGIDAAAHEGALEAGGVTVGVIGSGLDRFYPEENRDLAREIVNKGGAVVSEFPFGRPPDQETFPIRNHVVAALSRGVVAVEAPLRSGTLITTDIAADLGRTVMAVPARVDSRMSAGCLKLIRDGAVLVRDADDVLEALGSLFPKRPTTVSAPAPDPELPKFSTQEALVMSCLDEDGVSVDELVQRSGLSAVKVNALTMELRLKGFVRFLPGNRVATVR